MENIGDTYTGNACSGHRIGLYHQTRRRGGDSHPVAGDPEGFRGLLRWSKAGNGGPDPLRCHQVCVSVGRRFDGPADLSHELAGSVPIFDSVAQFVQMKTCGNQETLYPPVGQQSRDAE